MKPLTKGGCYAKEQGKPQINGARAVTAGDKAAALLPAFKRRVERALETVRRAAKLGNVGVAFSGGKDSTVLLDLVRRVIPESPAGFFDAHDAEEDCYNLNRVYGVQVVQPMLNHVEALKRGCYWGHDGPEPDWEFNFFETFVLEPSRRFIATNDLAVLGMGLRASESKGRLLGFKSKQDAELYWCDYDQTWHLMPLAWWKDDDVWAYIASRGLPYNAAYDKMTAIGVPRKQQRVGGFMGIQGLDQGKMAILRQLEPDRYRRFVQMFPKMGDWT